MAEPFIAEIQIWPLTFAPRSWAYCDGQIVAVSQFQALFALIGNTFGGNGSTTMGLPNLQGRTPMHFGSGPGLTNRFWGEEGGTPTVTLLESQLPAHTHGVTGQGDQGTQHAPQPQGYIGGDKFSGQALLLTKEENNSPVTMSPLALANTGGAQDHENRQPFLTIPFCIALEGIFPSRN